MSRLVAVVPPPDERPHFLSEAECHDIVARLARVTRGGGFTTVNIHSNWTGNVRWARNRIITSGDVRDNSIWVKRNVGGAFAITTINETTDEALVAAARRAERLMKLEPQSNNGELASHETQEPAANPALFSEATYNMSAEQRTDAAIHLAQAASEAGMLSAGYIQVSAHSLAMLDTLGHVRYFKYTSAEYSVTVRDPKGAGSGWAGLDWYDWAHIDANKLSAIALDKCLKSRNPVAIEPGRYTVILEPQAVCTLTDTLIIGGTTPDNDFIRPLDRQHSDEDDRSKSGVFFKASHKNNPFYPAISMLGDKVVDERLTISADPMDPEMGFPPFTLNFFDSLGNQEVYHPAVWIKDGILTELYHDREYAGSELGVPTGQPNSGAYRMSGGTTSMDEMISTTKRGLLVTRFDQIMPLERRSLLLRGYTRDGLWLVEDGKISKPVKNMVFTESVLFALNNILQLGVPQRVYHSVTNRPVPVIVPPLKISDFTFTAMSDAV